jgi:hypothetical protein
MSDEQVTVEQDGRTLTGVGADPASLAATMERHAPEPATDDHAAPQEAPSSPPEAPISPSGEETTSGLTRNPDGTFKKPSRAQRRFDQITAEREAAKREAADLRAQFDAYKQQQTQTQHPAPVPPSEPPPPPRPPTRPKPTEDQVGTAYPSYADFVEDLADWKAEQRLSAVDFDARIRTSIEADRASRTRDERDLTSIGRGRSRYPDFDAVLQGADHFRDGNWPLYMGQAISELPEPEHVYYQLAKDRALAERLRNMEPVQLGMALQQLVAPTAVAPLASTARTMSSPPPAPYQPVAGGGTTTVPSSAELAMRSGSDYDHSGYREQRARERGVKSRW